MTLAQYIGRVLQGLTRGKDELLIGVEEEAIEAQVGDAMKALADVVAGTELEHFLVTEFTFTMTAGVAALSANTQIRIDTIKEVRHPGHTRPMCGLPQRGDLDHPPSRLYDYYVLSENALYGRKGDGTAPADTAALKVLALRIPKTDFTDLPVQLEDKLIDVAVEMLRARGLDAA